MSKKNKFIFDNSQYFYQCINRRRQQNNIIGVFTHTDRIKQPLFKLWSLFITSFIYTAKKWGDRTLCLDEYKRYVLSITIIIFSIIAINEDTIVTLHKKTVSWNVDSRERYDGAFWHLPKSAPYINIIIIIIRSRRQQTSVESTRSGHDDEP